MTLLASHTHAPQQAGMLIFSTAFAVFMPFLYSFMGFIFGLLGAYIYNLVAKWVGGIEFEIE